VVEVKMSMVSVVMATYNGAEYVAEQVYSILNQTYRDFEIIIVDDCSQDATVEIIKKIFSERGFLNYRLVVNNNNMGVTKSFEKGVIESKGKYIGV
jgi:glycosyltransferase involved in cell wall biosynthesis